jgi:hypothetical protein
VPDDQMARIWWQRAIFGERLDQPGEKLCGLAQRAAAATNDPEVKQVAQGLVEKYCT